MVAQSGGGAVKEVTFCSKYEYNIVGQSLCGPCYTLSMAFAISILIQVFLEQILHQTEKYVHETSFEGVVNKVFKELTICGCLTFMNVMLNFGGHDADPLHLHPALYHADFIIFILSVSYVFQVSLHMILLPEKEKRWNIATNAQVVPLLNNFDEDSYGDFLRYLPFGGFIRDQLELKIFEAVFCEKFFIRKREFNFSSYLAESFKVKLPHTI